METKTNYEATLSTDCTCTYLDGDGNEAESRECWGCYGEQRDYIKEYFLDAWQYANKILEGQPVDIKGYAMGWQRLNGYATVPVENIIDTLTINGDYKLRFILSENYSELKVIRYSHDEPTGASFTVEQSLKTKCDYCGEFEECKNIKDSYGDALACFDCSNLYGAN